MNPASLSQDNAKAGRPHGLRLAVVEPIESAAALGSQFAGREDVMVVHANSVMELLKLAASDLLDAAVLDPELPDGWPMSVAEQAVDGLNGRLPLLIACRSPGDARMIGDRLSTNRVFVVPQEQMQPRAVLQLLTGAAAIKPG